MAKPADLTPQWTPQDRVDLRDFLLKHSNFLAYLAMERPKLPKTTPAADRQLNGLLIDAHFGVIEQIQEMASDGPPTNASLQS